MNHIDSAAFSNRGQRRELNQDAIFHQPSQTEEGQVVGLFIVCDGMGGRPGGEIASRIAVDTISNYFTDLFDHTSVNQTQPSVQTLEQMLKEAIRQANREIRDYACTHLSVGDKMGTTVTIAVMYGTSTKIANVGDGRAYAWRNDHLTQITEDHSLAAKLVAEGVIDSQDVYYHPHNNIILRALGIDDQLEIDIFDWELQIGDKLLLCTDGLWKAFGSIDKLGRWLGERTPPANLCQQLVNEAVVRDGSDNISAVVIRFENLSDC